jgi:hypothetical protein
MDKIKCGKCGYLNPADELMCGMCGEVFKKEKMGLGGKKSVEETSAAVAEEDAPVKTRTQKTRKAKVKLEEEPELISESEPEVEAVPKSAARKKTAAAFEEPATPPLSAANITSAIRNFLQTEEFRQAVKLIAGEAAPAKQSGPPSLSPKELKSIVESKIDKALPGFLQSDAVATIVREEVSKMPPPERAASQAAPALSEEELEKKIGDVLASASGRKGGLGGITMEAIELKVNAMIADIREKLATLPEETPATFGDVQKIVENYVTTALGDRTGGDGVSEERVAALVEEKLAAVPQPAPATEDIEKTIESRVKELLEEQATRELPQAPIDEGKIAALIDARVAAAKPAEGAAAPDPDIIKTQIQQALDAKVNSTEFSLLIMDIAREAASHADQSGGDAAAVSDEMLAARVGEILPDILGGDQFRSMIAAAADEVSRQPQITARDVERIVNTRFEILKSDLVDSDSFKKKVTKAVQAVSTPPSELVSAKQLEEQLAERVEALRKELGELVGEVVSEKLESENLDKKLRQVAAEEASKAAPVIPEPDLSQI